MVIGGSKICLLLAFGVAPQASSSSKDRPPKAVARSLRCHDVVRGPAEPSGGTGCFFCATRIYILGRRFGSEAMHSSYYEI